MTETRRKTHTSTQISASVPKKMAAAFKERCLERGVPQAQVIKAAIERFLEETEPEQKNFDVL